MEHPADKLVDMVIIFNAELEHHLGYQKNETALSINSRSYWVSNDTVMEA
tara:strand:+ start:272 stop:421 length:150 start_codon:yes stop_codon:yes gene_type:complete